MNRDAKGWAFPVGVNPHTGKTEMTEPKEDIRQSIRILLSTTRGERLLHPDYGCNLTQFMFEPLNYELVQRIKQEVYTSITKWERRIQNLEINLFQDTAEESRIVIGISYTISQLQEQDEIYYAYDLK